MSTPNEPRDPSTPDQPGAGGQQPVPPASGDVPPYPAGTGPSTPAAPGYGQPPAYGQQPPAAPGQPPAYGQAPAYGQTPAYGGYGQEAAGYGAAPQSTARNSLGVWSLVLGIVSVLLCCFVIGIVPGGIGLWLGIKGRGAAARGEASNGGLSLAGIIVSILGIVIGLYFLVSFAMGLAQYGGWDGFMEYVQSEVERQQQMAP
jgi:hypothetical protein